MARDLPFDIGIIGWGTRGARQLTLEHLNILKNGRDLVVSPGATDDLWELFRKLKLQIHDITPIYQSGAISSQVYRRIAKKVLDLGRRHGRTVFVQYGHPLVYSKPSELIIRESKKLGLRTIISPGISSMDQILCLLGVNIGLRDVQICQAGHLLMKKKRLNPHMDLVLFQPGTLGRERLCLSLGARRTGTRQFRKLQRHLEKFYPKTHPMWIVSLNGALDRSDQTVEATVGDLARLAPAFHVSHTIYIKGLP